MSEIKPFETFSGTGPLSPGDAVVHFEHGLAEYGGTEITDLGDETQALVTFIYRNGGKLMLPARDGQDFWPYGSPARNLTLDRLKSDDWVARRDGMIAEVRESAQKLADEDRERRGHTAIRLKPDTAQYAAFVDHFHMKKRPINFMKARQS